MLAGALLAELTESLKSHYLFCQLPETTLQRLALRFNTVTCKIGETVVAEGEAGDAAFLLYSGKLRVVKEGPDGQPLTLATLSPGEFVGEHALLKGDPRTATVRASQDSLLFRLHRDDFLELLEAQPEIRRRFQQLIDNRALARFLQTSTVFNFLPAKDIAAVLGQFSVQRFAENDAIVREGESGDRMFVLTSGDAKVVKGAGGNETVLAYLGPGDYFGERALLQAAPRYAGVVALSPVECAVLGREQFDKLVQAYPQIRERLAKHIADYAAREEAARKFGLRAPPPMEKDKVVWQTLDDEELPPTQVLVKGRRRWFGLTPAYPFIPQEDETDCGAASLAMIARFHNVRLSIERLRDLAHVGSAGASGLGLMQAAEKVGYECRPVNTDFGHLRKLQLPAIAHWQGYHFLVVYEVNGDRVLIGDPAEGLVKKNRAEFEKGWTGGLFLLTPTKKLGQIAPSRSAWRWLDRVLAPHHAQLWMLVVLSILLAASQLALAPLMQLAADRAYAKFEWILPLTAAALALIVLIFAGAAFHRLRLRRLLQQLYQKIAADQVDRLMQLPTATFSSRQVGTYLQRLEDTDAIRKQDAAHLFSVLFALALPVVGLFFLAFYHPAFAAIASITWLLGALIITAITPRLRQRLRRRHTEEISAQTQRQDTVARCTTVKQYGVELNEREGRRESLENSVWREEIQFVLLGLGAAAIAIVGALVAIVFAAWINLTAAQFLAVAALVVLTYVPLLRLAFCWPALLRWYLFAQRQADFLDVKTERALQHKNEKPHLRGGVTLQAVGYRHSPEAREVVTGLKLHIEPRQTLWVVGRSGAGKTTLAQLLRGILKPTAGTIRFDGYDLRDIDLDHLRRNVQVIGEGSIIVAGSVRENIALSSGPVDGERIINAAKLAGAHDFIMALPLGYETHLGAPGIELSAGQQQQICIARAVLADPRVLILDDATAILDGETESAVLKSLRWFATGRTLILMTRRKPTPLPADHIIVLDEGRIVERGTHSELMEQRGLYLVMMGGGVDA